MPEFPRFIPRRIVWRSCSVLPVSVETSVNFYIYFLTAPPAVLERVYSTVTANAKTTEYSSLPAMINFPVVP